MKEHLTVTELGKNEFFVMQGKVCRRLGFVAKGIMRFCKFNEKGEDLTCFFISDNGFAGDPTSFASQMPSTMNNQALTDCTLITFTLEDFQKLPLAVPRFREIFSAIDQRVTFDLLGQKDFMFNKDSAARYQEFMKRYPHILQQVPLGYIASYLEITPQSHSRLRKQLS